MYQSLYDLLMQIIFNGVSTPDSTLICTAISACAVVSLISIPFVIVFKFIRNWF